MRRRGGGGVHAKTKKTRHHMMTSWSRVGTSPLRKDTTGALMDRSPNITPTAARWGMRVCVECVYFCVCHAHLHWSELRGCDAHTEKHKQTHPCVYTQVAGQVQRAPLSCHPPLADLLFSRCSKRLLRMNYAAAGPCNKLQADSTPCVWLKI